MPVPDPETGGLRAGVAEDFPNGGGSRGYLFRVDGPQGAFSWFYQNTASAVDLHLPVVVDGIDYGVPLDNLAAALEQAGLESVDVWIGRGDARVAQLVLPILAPRAYLPIHWDGLDTPFEGGMPFAFFEPQLEEVLAAGRRRGDPPGPVHGQVAAGPRGHPAHREPRGEAGARVRRGPGCPLNAGP